MTHRSFIGGLALVIGCGWGCGGTGAASTGETEGSTTTTAADASTSGASSSGSSGGATETDTEGEHVPAVFSVEFDEASLSLSLLRDDVPLLVFPADGLQWGVVESIDEDASYDPMFELPVTWRSPTEGSVVDGGTLSVRLAYEGGGHALLRIDEEAPGRFSARWTPEDDAPVIAVHRFRARTDPQEGYYGLGEVFDTPNHRGRDRAMQLEVDLSWESSNNEAHVPIPFVLGTTGWGMFVQDPHPARFEMATEADDLAQITFGSGPAGNDGIAFHLFGAEHPLDLTAHYHAVTGTPARPAPWALGPWVWRNENTDQAQVEDDAATIRALDLATSALWIDRPYATGVNTFDFDPARYDDPQAMIDTLHDLGFRVALWHTPYVAETQEPATALFDEATAAGYFPTEHGPLLNNWGVPIDLTNPDAFDWWQALIGRYTDDMGIEGFKLDFAEDVVPGLGGGRLPWSFADGSDERTMQALYQRFYHQAYAQMLPAEGGGFLLCRAGTYGDQVDASVIWPGDLDANLLEAGDDLDGKKAVGGLPAAVVAGLSLGPSGFPLFASDTGGYRHSPPNKETMTRWFQHTALTPVMQIGTGGSNVAWEFTADNGFDDQMLDWYRDFTRLHLRLFPYLWTHVQRVAEDGRPIVRPLGLAHPELGVHPRFDYLLGDDLLVAPVVHAGETEREVVFPAGTWIDWFDGTVYEGPTTTTVPAPLRKLPLFLRAGGIVPLLRPSIDTLSPVGDADAIDSYATTAGVLHPRVVPGPPSAFELFDGSRIEQAQDGGITLRWHEGETFTEGVRFEVVGVGDAPSGLTLDGAPLSEGWTHDPALGGTLTVEVPSGDHEVVITP